MDGGGGSPRPGGQKRTGEHIWRAVKRTVRPLPGRVVPPDDPVPPAAAPLVAKAPEPKAVTSAPKLRPKGPGPLADRGEEKRVRRGKLDIGATLDLHGHTQEQALKTLRDFLERRREEGDSVVIVVTGKGGRLQSGEVAPGILKQRLPEWLASPMLRPLISGFAQAHQRHGGGGAFYVWLKRKG